MVAEVYYIELICLPNSRQLNNQERQMHLLNSKNEVINSVLLIRITYTLFHIKNSDKKYHVLNANKKL